MARLRRAVAEIEAGARRRRRARLAAVADRARSIARSAAGWRATACTRSRRQRPPTARRRWASRSRSPRASWPSARPDGAHHRPRISPASRRARSTGRASSPTGCDLSRLVFVRAPDAPALFRAMEEALKCGAPAAVVGEIWGSKRYDLAVSRRLLLAAREGGDAGAARAGERLWRGGALSSAAETRFEIAAAPSAHGLRRRRTRPARAAGLRRAARQGARCVGGAGRHGPRSDAKSSGLTWRSEERSFDEPAISLPLAAAAGDRPRAARASALIRAAPLAAVARSRTPAARRRRRRRRAARPDRRA